MTVFNLQTFPRLCHFENPKSEPEKTLKAVNEWKESFAQKFQHFYCTVASLERWVQKNCEVNMMPDDVLRLFIEKEILGSKMSYLEKKQTILDSETFGPLILNNIELAEARAVIGIDLERFIIDGKLSLNIVDSAKFGPEIHLQVYANAYEIEVRNLSKWSRAEIIFKVDQLPKLIAVLQKIATLQKLLDTGELQL